MFYRFLRILAKIATSIVFRKIHYSGLENIKSDRPTLIACNHPGGFTEPIVLACILNIPIHFLVRGDMFHNKWLRWLLINTNQIPIYRFKDGIKSLRQNQKHLNLLKEKLISGERIMIFVEGSTEPEMHLRPLQKGIARVAQDALKEQTDLLIDIVPMGVTFTDSTQFRSEIMLSVGSPITLDHSFVESEDKQKQKQFLEDLYGEMKRHLVHVEDLANNEVMQSTVQKITLDNWKSIPKTWIKSRTNLTQAIKAAEDINNGVAKTQSSVLMSISAQYKLLIIFGALLAIPGFIVYILPALAIRSFTKSKVKKMVFYSSILIACVLVTELVYHVLILLVLSILGLSWWYIFIIMIAGIYTLWYYDLLILRKMIHRYNSKTNE